MKKKLTAVLLCISLVLSLSVNISALDNLSTDDVLFVTDTETIPVTDEITVNVDENGNVVSQSGTGQTRSQTSGIISGAVYRIKNVASGKYMNVDYGTDANGTNIYQWTGDNSTEQKFRVVYSADSDSYLLYAMCSSNGNGRVADIYDTGGNLVNGANVKLQTANEPPSQQLSIISLGSGKYRIAMKKDNTFSYTAYGTSNGSASGTTSTSAGNIFISTYTGATNQQWEFEYLETANPSATPYGNLDTVSSTLIGGWAYQSDIPNTALTVHIYIINNSTGEQKIIGVTAGGYRADLENAGYGNGYHAFHYAIDWRTYKPATYTVRAYAIGVGSSVNPQLSYSPKTFTVRAPTGRVDGLSSWGISGWAWKPDAPNSPIDVHIYIYKSDGTQVAAYNTTANISRSDLASSGYGNGNHGFEKAIDWSSFPEERLQVVAYAVDGSGYNPSFYSGYYDNRNRISFLGMVDGNGIDRSIWSHQVVIDSYCQSIGYSSLLKSSTANDEYYKDAIYNSKYCVINTHGYKTGIEWSMRNVYEGHLNCNDSCSTCFGNYNTTDLNSLPDNYFSNTKCVVLMACSTAEGGENDNTNFVNRLHNKGVVTVVGFKETIWTAYNPATLQALVDRSSQKWITEFTRLISEGNTIEDSAMFAYSITLEANLKANGYTKQQYDDGDIPEDVLTKKIECGLYSYCVVGDPTQTLA